jgi:adenylate kinase
MAKLMVENLGYAHVSTGDALRAELKSGSELGRRVQQHMENGTLVPDELVADIVAGILANPAPNGPGLILDGFPRTLPQAKMLDQALLDNGLKLTAAVLFEVDDELLLARLTSRRVCASCGAIANVLFAPPKQDGVCDACGGVLEQRRDDTRETAVERLKVYERQTKPLIDFYDGRSELVRVNGGGEKDENFARLKKALGR